MQEKGSSVLSQWFPTALEFRQQAIKKSLHKFPDRSLCETVKMKSGWQWRPQDVGDAKAMRHLPRIDAFRE